MSTIYYRERPYGYRQFYAEISPLADVGIDDHCCLAVTGVSLEVYIGVTQGNHVAGGDPVNRVHIGLAT
jgi:hypothetical protein